MKYDSMSREELSAELLKIKSLIEEKTAGSPKLDLTRGKPGRQQLDLTLDMLGIIKDADDCTCENGIDCRNYGVLDGIPEAKKLFSELLGIPEEMLIIGGNSSLNMMFDAIVRAMLFGVYGSSEPWSKQGEIKFICPAPGYDRHFAICEKLGIKMIPVAMNEDGPDMEAVTKLVAEDDKIKGIWCVPKFSNPQGYTYSDETVRAFAKMKTAAPDFRIFWDNAYACHEVYDEEVKLLDIFEESRKYGNEDRVFYFASTSKITFPGSGVALMAASENNLRQIKAIMTVQTIGFDKINQIRHVKFFGNAENLKKHMKLHADVIRPRFETVLNAFKSELCGTATWTEPLGGYFVDLSVPCGCAKRVYELCGECGVALTKAGASFPYGIDPNDEHLRIAPTFPNMEDLKLAVEILCLCVKQAAIEKVMSK